MLDSAGLYAAPGLGAAFARLPERIDGRRKARAVDDVRSVESMNPRLKVISVESLFKSGDLHLGYRLILRAVSMVPRFGDAIRLLRCEFG